MSRTFEEIRLIVGGPTHHVRVLNLRFTNERLRERPDLVRKKIVLSINRDDVRAIDARFMNGDRLGTLQMIGPPINAPMTMNELDRAVRDFRRQK